jgi:hypothetical protein
MKRERKEKEREREREREDRKKRIETIIRLHKIERNETREIEKKWETEGFIKLA